MFFLRLVYFAMVQQSLACWKSPTDCPLCPVSDCETDQTTPVPSVSSLPDRRSEIASPPILTMEQSIILRDMGEKLLNTSCVETERMLYNTTMPSPIQLDEKQTAEIKDFYPEIVNVDERNIFGCSNILNDEFGPSFPKKRSVRANVCFLNTAYNSHNFALDKRGQPVFVAQSTVYNLRQTFQETLCNGYTCASNLQCNCENQLSHTAMAVISYLKNNDQRFYTAEIQLRACSAYLSI